MCGYGRSSWQIGCQSAVVGRWFFDIRLLSPRLRAARNRCGKEARSFADKLLLFRSSLISLGRASGLQGRIRLADRIPALIDV
jgi:hypothetical protein